MEKDTGERPPGPAVPRAKTLVALLLLASGFIYVALGLPLSNIDDFYFVGVAENLQATGQLQNPRFSEEYYQGFESKKFFFHPPFYPWLMARWIGFFGTNTTSLQLFAFCVTAVGALSVFGIGRRFSVSSAALLCLWATYFLCMARLGLRPEVAAFSSFFLATWLLLLPAAAPFWGILMLGLSVSFYPVTLVPCALVLCVALLVVHRRNEGYLKRAVWQGLLAFSVLLFAFLHLIDYELPAFVRSYALCANTQNAGALFSPGRLAKFVGAMSQDSQYLPKWPFVVLAVAAYSYFLVTHRLRGTLAALLGALLLSCIGAGVTAHRRSVELTTFIAFLVLFFLAGTAQTKRAVTACCLLGVCGLALAANALTVGSLALQRPVPPEIKRQIAGEVDRERAAGATVLVDSYVARHVLGWRVPGGVMDFCASRPLCWPRESRLSPRKIGDLREREVAVVSKGYLRVDWGHSGPQLASIFGQTLPPIALFPCEPFVARGANSLPGEKDNEQSAPSERP